MTLDFAVAALPIALLILLMVKPDPMPSQRALPLAAATLYLLRLTYFRTDANATNATVVQGLLTAWTPILIVWGAILLFKTLEHSGAMEVIRRWLNGITPNRVGQVMIVGWSFSFLVEGVCGFGTPAALAAPVLVGLGIDPVRAALVTLVMNSAPICFGAVGTPVWFGLREAGLNHAELLAVGMKAALVHSVAAVVIAPVAMSFVAPWRTVARNVIFIVLSVVSTIAPMIILARWDYDFPTVLGGVIGLPATILWAKYGVGMMDEPGEVKEKRPVRWRELARAAFPLWASVLVLLLTRVEFLGLKGALRADSPAWSVALGSLGEFCVSPGLVVQLKGIFGAQVSWRHELLYVPSVLPFFVVSAVSFVVFGMKGPAIRRTWEDTWRRMWKPLVALSATLVFVKLLMVGGERSCAMVVGHSLAAWVGQGWQFCAAFLGAVGAFFAGSNTVSNLTFAGIQNAIAVKLNLDRTTILALQHVGGAAGLMVSIHHVVAACAVLGINDAEGEIIKRAVAPMVIYVVVAGVIGGMM